MGSGIYTRTGDKGTTSLVGGARVSKSDLRLMAYGDVDEANSWIGLARATVQDPLLANTLAFVQHRFFNCSSNLATPTDAGIVPVSIDARDVAFLENAIDAFEGRSGKIGGFILPGGTVTASHLHVARTICRRAERHIWQLAAESDVDAMVVQFINRSSDLLFAAARYANCLEQQSDVFWQKDFPIPVIPPQ